MSSETVLGNFLKSFRRAWSKAIADEHVINSPDDIVTRTGGQVAEKLLTLTADGDPVSVNAFEVTGLVELKKIYLIFEDVTEVTDIEEVRFELWDGTNSVDLSLAGGVACDDVILGSAVLKVDAATAALTLLNADQIRLYESSKNDVLNPSVISVKNGVTNYIRLQYKNADTNLNCQVRVFAEWRHFSVHGTGDVSPV